MKTLTDIDTQIDALREVSTNALTKHGFSRSRQRLFDLSNTLHKSWQDYKVVHGKTYYKELTLFVVSRSALGLRYRSIIKRSGLHPVTVHDCLSELIKDGLVIKKLNGDKLIYRAKK